ncbi:Proteasome subunit beta type-3 [Nymphaea thermarum]|nr:Proteasome subunit beta type-3 [Nymphaea thermarum]
MGVLGELAKDFVVGGTSSESLYGACESMYKPDMEPDELFETISQALLASIDRDCLSGWGAHEENNSNDYHALLPTWLKLLKDFIEASRSALIE